MTGDIGVLDADGYLTITDRKKDIIIRGGENVSAAEVEEILVRMPDVAEVAVVAAPDDAPRRDRVRVLPHAARRTPRPTSPTVRACLERGRPRPAEVARASCATVDEFPRTPSGKVQKFVLRQRLREEAAR